MRPREAAAARITQLRREAAESIPDLQAKLAAHEDDLAAHDRQRTVLLDGLAIARTSLSEERNRVDRGISAAESKLLATRCSPPCPSRTAACRWPRDPRDRLGQRGRPASTRLLDGTNPVRQAKVSTAITNFIQRTLVGSSLRKLLMISSRTSTEIPPP